jgi:hypothetical protein
MLWQQCIKLDSYTPCLFPLQVHVYNGGTTFSSRTQSWLQANLAPGQYWGQTPNINRGQRGGMPHIVITFDRVVRLPECLGWQDAVTCNPVGYDKSVFQNI